MNNISNMVNNLWSWFLDNKSLWSSGQWSDFSDNSVDLSSDNMNLLSDDSDLSSQNGDSLSQDRSLRSWGTDDLSSNNSNVLSDISDVSGQLNDSSNSLDDSSSDSGNLLLNRSWVDTSQTWSSESSQVIFDLVT